MPCKSFQERYIINKSGVVRSVTENINENTYKLNRDKTALELFWTCNKKSYFSCNSKSVKAVTISPVQKNCKIYAKKIDRLELNGCN